MREAVGGDAVPAHHPGPDGHGERLGHGVGRLAGRQGDQVRGEPLADDGGRPQRGGRGAGQAREPQFHGLVHAGRDTLLAAAQQPRDLLHEERVAAGPPVHAGRDLGRALLPHHVRDQVADRVRAEPGQRQHGGPRRQRGQHRTRRRAGSWFGVAVAARDRHRPGGQAAGEEVEQQLRRLVGPLQVVEEQEQRLDPRLGQQQRGHLVEQPEPLGGRRVPDRLPAILRGPRDVQAEHPHDLDPRPVARRALAGPAPAPGDPGATALRKVGRGREHRGLADARLAR